MPDIQHFDYPFRFGAGGHAVTVEQDSIEEITAGVIHVLKTTIGTRVDLPEFGVPELVMREGGVNVNGIISALRVWEPRATNELTVSEITDLAQRISLRIQGNSNA